MLKLISSTISSSESRRQGFLAHRSSPALALAIRS
jgi:hypothetical protein